MLLLYLKPPRSTYVLKCTSSISNNMAFTDVRLAMHADAHCFSKSLLPFLLQFLELLAWANGLPLAWSVHLPSPACPFHWKTYLWWHWSTVLDIRQIFHGLNRSHKALGRDDQQEEAHSVHTHWVLVPVYSSRLPHLTPRLQIKKHIPASMDEWPVPCSVVCGTYHVTFEYVLVPDLPEHTLATPFCSFVFWRKSMFPWLDTFLVHDSLSNLFIVIPQWRKDISGFNQDGCFDHQCRNNGLENSQSPI